jgi:anti-anti-sigma factor
MTTPASETWQDFEVEQVGEAIIVRFTCSSLFEEETIRLIGKQLTGLAERESRPRLLLDFSQVNYFSSSLLALLIRLHKKTNSAGGRLALCGFNADLIDMFTVTQLHKMLNLFRGEQEALQALNQV